MNKIKIISFAVLAFSLIGCQKRMDGPDEGSLVVSIESGGTKTTLGDNDRVCWSDGDKIFVNGADASHTLTVLPFGTDATTATLSGSVGANSSGHRYYGYYPANTAYWAVSATARQVKLPATRTYNPANLMDCVPMYAESDGNYLTFKSLFGLLEISLTGNEYHKVTSLKLSCTAGNLAGTFNIDATGKAVISGTGTKTVTVNCPTGGVELGKITGKKFYIAIPEGSYTNLRLDVCTDTGGGIGETVSSLTVKRGEVYPTAFYAEPAAVQLWDGGPYWATTNIEAYAEDEFGGYYGYGAVKKIYSALGSSLTFLTSNPDATRFPQWSVVAADSWKRTAFCTDATGSAFSKYDGTYLELTDADDVAYNLWGPDWQIPTREDCNDLISKTNTSWVTINGKTGRKCVSKTDASKYIFLPGGGYYISTKAASGVSYYATRNTGSTNKNKWYHMYSASGIYDTREHERYRVVLVRPIRHK